MAHPTHTMITKTEVKDAIRRCEPHVGASSSDRSAVTISRGDLLVLIEAAKRAQYESIGLWRARSSSEFILSET